MGREGDDHGGPADPRGPAESDGSPSIETCLKLLADHRRRLILSFFLDSGPQQTTVADLADGIADAEKGATGRRPSQEHVRTTLLHVHLPKFEDAGVLEYDARSLSVRYRGDPRLAELYETVRRLE